MPLEYPRQTPLATRSDLSPLLCHLANHRDGARSPTIALAALCQALPEHADWMKWYGAVVLHSEYLRRLASLTAPSQMISASVYSIDESNDPRFQEQVRNGIKLSDKHYLRRFPVWFEFRGNSGTTLSQAKALSAAMPNELAQGEQVPLVRDVQENDARTVPLQLPKPSDRISAFQVDQVEQADRLARLFAQMQPQIRLVHRCGRMLAHGRVPIQPVRLGIQPRPGEKIPENTVAAERRRPHQQRHNRRT
jgi:hypothetical protein